VRQWGDVLDGLDDQPCCLKGCDRALAARPGSLHSDIDFLDTHFNRFFGGLLGRHLSRIGSTFTASLEAACPGTRPANRFTLQVRDRDHRIIEGRLNVDDRLGDVPSDLFTFWTNLSHVTKPRRLSNRLILVILIY